MRNSMRRIIQRSRLVLTLGLALAPMGCALFLSEESRYLLSAKDRATESDVRKQLGEPARITSSENGQKIVVYQTRRHVQQGTNNAWTTLDVWQCDTYSLKFDDKQILRDWKHASREC